MAPSALVPVWTSGVAERRLRTPRHGPYSSEQAGLNGIVVLGRLSSRLQAAWRCSERRARNEPLNEPVHALAFICDRVTLRADGNKWAAMFLFREGRDVMDLPSDADADQERLRRRTEHTAISKLRPD